MNAIFKVIFHSKAEPKRKIRKVIYRKEMTQDVGQLRTYGGYLTSSRFDNYSDDIVV